MKIVHGDGEDQGKLWFGREGERVFGYKNFLELYSIFTSPPLFTVLHGRKDLGLVHESSFFGHGEKGDAVLLLAGRSWSLKSLDWSRRVAYVEPAPTGGSSRWCGGTRHIHFEHAQAIQRVLATGVLSGMPSNRATQFLEELRNAMPWVDEQSTTVVRSGSETLWWTFAGLLANQMITLALGDLSETPATADNLAIALKAGTDAKAVQERMETATLERIAPVRPDDAMDALKFSSCLPLPLATRLLAARLEDIHGMKSISSMRATTFLE